MARGIVTLLFTDLVGSTELLGRLGEDAAAQLHRRHVALLRAAIARHDDTAVQNLGDGLMVVFPSAIEAVNCAVAMQLAIHRDREGLTHGRLGLRIGLHAGEPSREGDDWCGTPVLVAKRLCDRAAAGEILASELVGGLVGSRGGHSLRQLGQLSLKGLAEPVATFEVLWEPASEDEGEAPGGGLAAQPPALGRAEFSGPWIGVPPPAVGDDVLQAGFRALRRGGWEEARGAFERALADEGDRPELLEGLAWAAWWLEDAPTTLAARERAYNLYRDGGKRAAAARMATWLAVDHMTFKGEAAVANGWLQRAARLLEGHQAVPEQALLSWYRGHFALLLENDAAAARTFASQAAAAARALHCPDLEIVALGLEGLALVGEGRVEEGMRHLDEASAAALGGETEEPLTVCSTCCYLIFACEKVRDFDRAAQWCEIVSEVSRRWEWRHMFSLCRTHYASVLIARGSWREADAELERATRELASSRRALAADGVVRLAELRRRQGRFDEAALLLDQATPHPLARLVGAALALDQGSAVRAAELAERFLRHLPESDRLERIAALEQLVRARIALGDLEAAGEALADLSSAAGAVATDAMRAAASAAAGALAAAAGDHDRARRRLEDAVDLYERSESPFEAANTRLELARALAALGRTNDAAREARVALATLDELGAREAGGCAGALVRQLERQDGGARPGELSPREVEVLRLVAEGLRNPEIAERLVVSEHTVRRHVANILGKLRVPSRTAAATEAVRRGWL